MKTIGLLGGMSWESTVPYYQTINRAVARELGGQNSAKVLIYSVNFQELLELLDKNRWDEIGRLLGPGRASAERCWRRFPTALREHSTQMRRAGGTGVGAAAAAYSRSHGAAGEGRGDA